MIIPHLRHRDAAGGITELAQPLHAEGVVTDSLAFCEAALNREFLAPTHVASLAAFPHARSPVVARLALAIGRSKTPVPWGRTGGMVRLIFPIAVPQTCSAEYLNLLSKLAELFRNPDLRQQLIEADEAFQMFEVMKQLDAWTDFAERSPAEIEY